MTVDLDAVKDYLAAEAVHRTDAQIDRALATEAALQRRACRFPADDDDSETAADQRTILDGALCRRVAVNLARTGLPLGMQMSDVGAARLTTNDPEVRRMESPYRKVTTG